MKKTTVLIADDNVFLRLGLKEAISNADDLAVTGESANAAETLEKYRQLKPDVVTLDYRMPGRSGVECAQDLLAEFPDAKIIMFSVYESDEIVWNAFQAGVKGYLPKSCNIEILQDAIRAVAEGSTYFPASIIERIDQRKEQEELTPREYEVLKLIAQGMANKEISDALHMAEATTKMHVSRVMKKLGALDRTQAALLAVQRGIVEL